MNNKTFITVFRLLLPVLVMIGMLLVTFPALSQFQHKIPIIKLIYNAPLAEETSDMLRLTINKSSVLHLDHDVKSIRINDPERLIVFIKDPRTLYVLAKEKKGITHFTALDENGKTVMARYVIVEESKLKYVRARILCKKGMKDEACGKTRLYYCTGSQCYETYIMHLDKTTHPN